MHRLPRLAAAFGGTLLCLLLVRHGRVSADANGAALLSGAGGLKGPYRTRCADARGNGELQRLGARHRIGVDLVPAHRDAVAQRTVRRAISDHCVAGNAPVDGDRVSAERLALPATALLSHRAVLLIARPDGFSVRPGGSSSWRARLVGPVGGPGRGRGVAGLCSGTAVRPLCWFERALVDRGCHARQASIAFAQSLELVEQFQRAARTQFIRIDLLQAPFHRGGRRYGGWGGGRGGGGAVSLAARARGLGVVGTAGPRGLPCRPVSALPPGDLTPQHRGHRT